MAEKSKSTRSVVRLSAAEGHAPFTWTAEASDPNDELFGSLVTTDRAQAGAADLILYGLPDDAAVLGRKGAAAGPRALRLAAKKLKTGLLDGSSIHIKVCDLGDADLPLGDVVGAQKEAARWAESSRKAAARKGAAPARVVMLGGDHSFTYPAAKPYLDAYGKKLAVINLDAHLDVRAVPDGRPPNSGTSFGRLLDAGLAHYVVVGARAFQNSGAYVRQVLESGGRIVSADEVVALGARACAENVLKQLPDGIEAIYLSVDLDVADASVAPGVSAPTPGGLGAHHLYELVRTLCADGRVVACDMVELAPALDVPGSDRTARLAAGCLAEMTAAQSKRLQT